MHTPVWIEILGSVCSGLCFFIYAAFVLSFIFFAMGRVERVYQNLISQWATEHGWEILKQERRVLKHPWLIEPISNQRVYYVTVTYQDGRPFFRHAWIRCGGWWWRPEKAKLEFVWDERVPQPLPPPLPEPAPPQEDPLWDKWVDSS
jgi:hypothetical protein